MTTNINRNEFPTKQAARITIAGTQSSDPRCAFIAHFHEGNSGVGIYGETPGDAFDNLTEHCSQNGRYEALRRTLDAISFEDWFGMFNKAETDRNTYLKRANLQRLADEAVDSHIAHTAAQDFDNRVNAGMPLVGEYECADIEF